jgi:uncharacterized protein (TIGR02246 family)
MGPIDATECLALYTRLLEAWNRRSADDFAALFEPGGHAIGFDGSQMNGRAEIASTLKAIFEHHQTASYVASVREMRQVGPGTLLVRAAAGLVAPGTSEVNPAVNAIQSVVITEADGALRIALLQNTPAAFHQNPQASEDLTRELTAVLRAGRVVQLA